MRREKLKYVIFMFAIAFSINATAQLSETHWWGNYTYNQSVKEHLQVSMRFEMRYYNINENLYRAGISPKLQYKTDNNLKYIIGTRFFYYDTESRDGIIEYRPWLGFSYSHPSQKTIQLSHQVKWEHRFFSQGSSSYESRIRYKFKIGTTLFEQNESSLKVAFAPELFWSFKDSEDYGYKSTRWGVPISYRYSKRLLLGIAPFLQTNHNGLFNILDDKYGVIQLNLKTFL